jgi:hypothetical protein
MDVVCFRGGKLLNIHPRIAFRNDRNRFGRRVSNLHIGALLDKRGRPVRNNSKVDILGIYDKSRSFPSTPKLFFERCNSRLDMTKLLQSWICSWHTDHSKFLQFKTRSESQDNNSTFVYWLVADVVGLILPPRLVFAAQ